MEGSLTKGGNHRGHILEEGEAVVIHRDCVPANGRV